jgi:hypothetical protein
MNIYALRGEELYFSCHSERSEESLPPVALAKERLHAAEFILSEGEGLRSE